MPLLRHRWTGARVWRSLWIVVAIGALTASLATRYIVDLSQAHAVKSVERRSQDLKRQHLDRDAAQWVAPVASFHSLPPAAICLPPSQTGLPLPNHHFDESLYNRPPPSSGFFL